MFDFKESRPARPSARIKPPETPGVEGLITLAVGVTVVAALYFAREILIPVTLAILLSFLVAPLANLLGRIRLGHVVSVLLAVTMSLSVIVVIGAVIAAQITDLAVDIPRYQASIDKKIDAVHGLTVEKLNRLASAAGQALQRATVDPPKAIRESASSSAGSQPPMALPVEVREPAQTPFQLARRILSPVVSPLETAFIVFIVTIVILLQRDDLRDRTIRLFGSRDLHRTTTAMDEAARRLSRYFVSQLGVNAGVGIVIGIGIGIGIGLSIIGVPGPVLWGGFWPRCCVLFPTSESGSPPFWLPRSPRPSVRSGRWRSGRWCFS